MKQLATITLATLLALGTAACSHKDGNTSEASSAGSADNGGDAAFATDGGNTVSSDLNASDDLAVNGTSAGVNGSEPVGNAQ